MAAMTLGAPSMELTDGHGADVILDYVASSATLGPAFEALAPDGRLVIQGVNPPGDEFRVEPRAFVHRQVSVAGSRYASRREVAEAIELVRRGTIRPVVSRTAPLERSRVALPVDRRPHAARPCGGRHLGASVSAIGSSPLRVEDEELLTGRALFVADLPRPPGCLELRFVRSYEAHAAVRAVDLDAARTAPGVVGAFGATDLPGLPAMPPAPGNPVPDGMDRPALARDRVRFVGEAVAVVAAEGAARAEDAAELVMLDLDPLERRDRCRRRESS